MQEQEENFTIPLMYQHPSLSDYYTNLNTFVINSLFIGFFLTTLNILIFCTTLTRLRKNVGRPFFALSATLCALYPIISLMAFITLLLPKSWLICHTVMHLLFPLGAVLFRRLCLHYVKNKVIYIKVTDGAAVSINTPPCCCCCLCLPGIRPSRRKFCLLRYMIWQMPIIQCGIMLYLNVIYVYQKELYENTSLYFIPLIVGSIMFGSWALNITARMVTIVHSDYAARKKMLCLQLIILLCKLQFLILNFELNFVEMGGAYPMNHVIYKQTYINILIMFEIFFVSLLAQSAYRVPMQTAALAYSRRVQNMAAEGDLLQSIYENEELNS